ncbi:FAD-dependent oxidoreductase [Legionella spiritensis]|uniref:FAD-dependent oxidoreductase n=1 Tax=Legionella spiritensis TaxID=452 RepID=UPI000F6CBA2B|nr:FAD-dependent oxidoreductase [Legionella spiritensis]VEG91651.1 amine oxidase, flavin containing [Legionella spiritensis]
MYKLLIRSMILFSILVHPATADRVAIIGGGGAGLVTAWLIEQNHDVTLYESENRLGGHINSIEIKVDGEPVIIEGGAEFFNETSYPHFLRLLRFYNMPLKSFTLVTTFYDTHGGDEIMLPPYHDGTVEWKSLKPYNLRRALNLKTVIDKGHHIVKQQDVKPTLQEVVDETSVGDKFKDTFLYPFLASAWGVTTGDIRKASAYNSLKYMVEGNDSGNYKWFEVKGGLSQYIITVKNSLARTRIKLNNPVSGIVRDHGVFVITDKEGRSHEYDHVVLATNANVAASLISHLPDMKDLVRTLNKIRYFDTKIAIHGDKRFMPASKGDWRLVNIRYDGVQSATTMYKKWKSKSPVFKSWVTYDVRDPKDKGSAMPEKLYALLKYKHPHNDRFYFEAQEMVRQIQGHGNLWFAGMWTYDNDSHESAIISAMNVAEHLAPGSRRLEILKG